MTKLSVVFIADGHVLDISEVFRDLVLVVHGQDLTLLVEVVN